MSYAKLEVLLHSIELTAALDFEFRISYRNKADINTKHFAPSEA